MESRLTDLIEAKAEEIAFSGVLSVKIGDLSLQKAYGYRDRANKLENNTDTRFATASGTKGFTALGIAKLIEEGKLELDTLANRILGDRIKNLHSEITLRHLLSHTSGMGDHYDEDEMDDVNEVFLPTPAYQLISPFDYIPLLEEKDQKFAPGEKAVYCNAGFVVLAMIVEAVSEKPFQAYIEDIVFDKAGMKHSGFFMSDRLPENSALGYVSKEEPLRTNVFQLPIIGSGDGGAYTTLADMDRFWSCLKSGDLVETSVIAPFIENQGILEDSNYGYGFGIDAEKDLMQLIGHDCGVSFYSTISRSSDDGFTILSNTSGGVWPLARLIEKLVMSDK